MWKVESSEAETQEMERQSKSVNGSQKYLSLSLGTISELF
jgi:hypothetical protein